MFLRKRIGRLLVLLALIGLSTTWLPDAARATHYPEGYKCSDCHSLTGSTMVIGTKLIKSSPVTADLVTKGWVPGNAMPCLFCHNGNSGFPSAPIMKPVNQHFGASVASKHDANYTSSFGDAPGDFGCLKCHPNAGLPTAVAYNATTGDANVHGVDAKTQYVGGAAQTGNEVDRVASVFASLVTDGVTPTPTAIQPTCAAASCHGGAGDNTIDGRVAKKLHPMGAGYTDCAECHASHRGEQQGSLVVLLKDGSVDPQDGTSIPASSFVQPKDCGECHEAIATDHNTKGHGKAGIAISCEICHKDTVPHSFATGGGANPLRFGLTVADAGGRSSILRQQPPYNEPFSICLTCHAVFADKLHGTADVVGCADCHEPHGIGVGANIKMVREVMPKIDAAGNPVYIAGGVYDPVVYTSPADNFPAAGNTGLCDNAECHSGQKNANNVDIYPLATFMATPSTGHTGGVLAPGAVCDTCHSHTDAAGSWGAASSCDGCHGNPPATNVHAKHATAGFLCDSCHTSPGTGLLHNELAIANATQFNDLWSTTPLNIRNKIDLSVTYSIAKAGKSSMATYGDCTTACHGTALAAATQGSDIAPTWNVPSSGACGTCHKDKTTNPFSAAGNVHKKHAADRNVGCEVCHSATYTGTVLNYPEHVNGSTTSDVDLKAGATFNGAAVTMTYNAGSCSNISCHGAWKAITWNAADSCANCHSYPPDGTSGTTNHDATAPVDKTIAELKSAHGNCTTCHGVSAASDVTQNSFGVPSDTTASGGDAYVIATNHVDAKVQMNGISAPNNNQSAEYDEAANGCNKACHDNTYKITQIRANVVELKELGAGSCDGCHGGAGAFWPNTAGFVDNAGSPDDDAKHTVHMTALAQRVYGESLAVLITTTGNGAPDVKQKALCEYCHAAVTNDDGHTSGDDAEVFVTNIATVSTRFAKNMKTIPDPDPDAAYAAGACTNVDCHNSKSTAPTYNWYTAATTNCMMCHTVGSGNNPVSGLHNAARISSNLHDDSFQAIPNQGVPSGVCTTCHTTMPAVASQTSTHIDAIFQGGVGQSVQMGLFANYTQSVDNVGTCATTGGLSTCHSDGGAWNRVWNANAANSDGAECANCHGGLVAGYGPGAYTGGMTPRHSNAGIPGNHATCDYCHEYNNGSTTPYNINSSQHRDGSIQFNAAVVGDLGYIESGTAPNKQVGCTNCHLDDATHRFDMVTDGNRWTRANIDGGAYNCTGCHATDAPHTGTGMSSAVHTTHSGNLAYAPTCNVCHLNNGPGDASHQNGTVNFGGTRMTTAFNYTRASNNFSTGANCTGAANGCHDAAASTWTAPATITCANCHNVGSNGVVDAGKLMDQGMYPPNSASHTPHLNTTTGGGATCNDCHGANATAGTHAGHKNNLITVAGAAATYTGGLVPRDASNAGTCGVNTCHNNGQNAAADTPAYAWGTQIGGATNTCVECHGDTAVLMTTQAHSAHLNVTVGTFGRTIACSDCHGASPQTQATHANGTINLSGLTYTGGDVAVALNGGTFGTCGVNSCHNDGTGAGQATNPAWNAGAQPNCTICHLDTTTMASNSHNEHMNGGYTGAACTDCHTAATVATHLNGSTNFAAGLTYSKGASFVNDATASGTCTTTNCHNRFAGAGSSAAWDIPTGTGTPGTNDLACNACHYYNATPTAANYAAYTGGAMSASHSDHFTATKTCTQCHGTLPTTTSHIAGKTTLVDGSVATYNGAGVGEATVAWNDVAAVTDYTYNTTTHTCTTPTPNGLGCHATGGPDWDVAFPTTNCTDCHTDTATAAVNPTSGLHGVVPSVSGQQHNQTVTGGCVACHSAMPAVPGTHMGGTFTGNGSVAGDRTNMGLFAVFTTSGADDSGTCVGTAVGCHDTTRNTWAHKWMTPANYTTSPAACTGCHGNIASGFNAGVDHLVGQLATDHPDTGTANNYGCETCHALQAATGVYPFTFGTADWAPLNAGNKHGDANITMNDDGTGTITNWQRGTGGNSSKSMCVTCHTNWTDSAPQHWFTNTTWTPQEIVGDAVVVACGACHTGGVTPSSASGAHAAHGVDSSDLVAGGAACVDCHGNNGGSNYQTTLAGTHGIGGAVNFANVTYSMAGTRGNLTGTCLTANCHNVNTGSDQSTAWNSTALACDDCHYYAAGTTATQAALTAYPAARRLSDDHGVHFGTGGATFSQCSTCHGTDPVAGDTTHINGVTTLTDKAVAAQDEANVIVTTWNDTTNNCANTTCHNPSTTTYSATWQSSTGSCDLCHSSTNPTTGDHTEHMTGGATFGRVIACVDCHNNTGYTNRHTSGTKNVQVRNTAGTFGAAIATPTTAGACGTNECHNDGSGAAPVASTYQWGNATPITNCLECHQNGATMATNSHNEHMNAGYANAVCIECHTAETNATKHLNRSLDVDTTKVTLSGAVAGAVALGTVNGTCTTVNCHNRFAGAGASAAWNIPAGTDNPGVNDLACNACHYYQATPSAANYASYTGGAMSASHSDHFTAAKLCTDCHGAAITNTTHISVKTGTNGMQNGAQAALDEAAVSRASMTYSAGVADAAGANNTCTGGITLGCHATGAPDWDVAFATTACTNCHTDTTTAAVNPTSGLHSVVPTVSGQQHNQSVTGGCVACHSAMPAVPGTHMGGTFTGNGSVAGDRTNMGLFAVFTTSGADNSGTCVGTAAGCHDVTRNTWAHKWDSTASYYTTSPSACAGCHGINAGTGFNTGVDHKATATMASTHGGTGSYDCQECHMMEYNGGNPYVFAFGTNDWGGTSKHGNGTIEINSKANYDDVTNRWCAACHSTATYQFVDTTWPVDKTLTGPDFSGCNVCHGSPATGQFWPNGTPGSSETPPASATYDYADNATGAHQTHIDAIGSVRGWSTVTQKNQTCNYCHPNPGAARTGSTDAGDHKTEAGTPAATVDVYQDGRVASETQYFKKLSGTDDASLATAAYNNVTKTCANIDCHGDITTPAWLDVAGPTFSPSNAITVTNPVSDGDLSISWNAATDALSPPVKYDLYRHTAAGDACTLGSTIATNLGSLGYVDSGLTNGTTYYYCVKAKDSSSPANTTSSTTASAAPTAPAGTAMTYYLNKSTTATIYGSTLANSAACGTAVAAATPTSATTPNTNPYPVRGVLGAAVSCGTASTSNYVYDASPVNAQAGGTYENMVGFFSSAAYASPTLVTGAASGTNLFARGSGTADDMRIWLATMNATTGAMTLSSSVDILNMATSIGTAKAPNMSTMSVTVPAGEKLGFLITWSNDATSSSINDRLAIDNYAATMQSRIAVSELTLDSTAPTYTSTSLVATDAGVGGAVDLTWTAATDTSTPIHYDVYASTSNVPATLFASPVQTSISTNSTTVTGLTNSTTYYFGVRASDAFGNTDTNTFVSTGVAPTASGGGSCTTCHGMPPATGAHLVHATSSVNDCNKCHGNTTYQPSTAYTNGYTPSIHANGAREMWFQRKADGSASGDTNAAWGGTTCTNVDCHFNVTTPNWVGGSTTCASCHAFPPVAASGTVDHDANLTVAPATLANFLTSHDGCEKCHGATSSDGTANGTFTAHANYPAGSHGDGLIRINGPDATPGPAVGAQYDDANFGCNKACHPNNATYQMAGSPTRTVNYADFGAGDCPSCHDNAAKVATVPQVSTSSSHTDADGAGATYPTAASPCEDCHPFHADGTYGTNDVGIPTQRTTPVAGTVPSLNWSYSTHNNAISLGGVATAGYAKSTEAEICWACHDANGVSEWGTNNKAKTGNIAYNYGSLWNAATGGATVSNWTSAFWRSGTVATNATNNFSYKTGLITSTHSVNFNSGTAALIGTANSEGYRYGSATIPDSGGTLASPTLKETRDAVANIRCSYCHDVHGTHNGVGGDTAGVPDQPYLRGTWKGNPYPEDGAPRAGWTNWNDNNNFNLVPRGSAASTNTGKTGVPNLGGYWIDQNSGDPNLSLKSTDGSGSTASAGLCALCHAGTGNVNGTWTAAELNVIDYTSDPTGVNSPWVSTTGAVTGDNGHRNVVVGASGSTNVNNNIFTRTRRGSATRQAQSTNPAYLLDPGVSYSGTSARAYGYRGNQGPALIPTAGDQAYTYQMFAWSSLYRGSTPAATFDISSTAMELEMGGMASGSTGALTEAASYAPQTKYHTFTCSKCHNPHASRLPKLMITNCLDTNHNTWDDASSGKATGAPAPFASTRAAQWSTAQNCHRLDSNAAKSASNTSARGDGWNRVTPWVESNTPDP